MPATSAIANNPSSVASAGETLQLQPSPPAKTQATVQDHLKALIRYAEQHLPVGNIRSNSLIALRHYAQKYAGDRKSTQLSPIEITAHEALDEFVQALNNPQLAQVHKTSALINLSEGLGVCKEGECLNILDCTRQLKGTEAGLKQRWQHSTHQLIEQTLLALVKREGQRTRSASLAEKLEIHDVQALKNHLASDWGLPVQQDRHASRAFQRQAGDMARELLKLTVPPSAVAQVLSTQLVNLVEGALGEHIRTGMPSSALQGDALQRLLQTEFGNDINLHGLLAFSEDYSTVKLKSPADIEAHLLSLAGEQGLIPNDPESLNARNTLPMALDDALQQVEYLRGPLNDVGGYTAVGLYSLGMHWGFPPPLAQGENSLNDPFNRRKEREHTADTESLGHNFQGLGVKIPMDQNQDHQGAKGNQ